jgi:hypothetical protein
LCGKLLLPHNLCSAFVFQLLPIESSAKKFVKRREEFGWILKEFSELLHLKSQGIGLIYFSASKKGC